MSCCRPKFLLNAIVIPEETSIGSLQSQWIVVETIQKLSVQKRNAVEIAQCSIRTTCGNRCSSRWAEYDKINAVDRQSANVRFV